MCTRCGERDGVWREGQLRGKLCRECADCVQKLVDKWRRDKQVYQSTVAGDTEKVYSKLFEKYSDADVEDLRSFSTVTVGMWNRDN